MKYFYLNWSFVFCLVLVFNSSDKSFALKSGSQEEKCALREHGCDENLQSKTAGSIPENKKLDDVHNVPKSHKNSGNKHLKRDMTIEGNLQPIFGLLPKIKNKECVRDVTHILNGLKHNDKWALQLFDALPKFPVGLMYGNMYQLGNFEECIHVKHVTDDGIHIKGQYCLADVAFKLRLNTSGFVQPIVQIDEKHTRAKFNASLMHWGICLPSTCTPADGRVLVKEVFSSFIEFNTLDVNIEDKNCYYEKPQNTSLGEIIYGSIIASFLVFILIATFIHIWHIRERRKYVSYNVRNVDSARGQKISTTREVILSFSLIRTVTKFLHTAPTELNLECICGVKFLSMSLILGGHSLIFLFGSPLANADFVDEMSKKVENSIFVNGSLLVDIFLLVGGFLMCRLLLIELDKRKGNVNIPILYIARYIRLTPAYLVVIGFYLTWLPNIGNGPLWKTVTETENLRCRESWWINLLYINNYVHTNKLCMFQAWYLAADYHLFIIAPLIIYPLWKWPKAGLSLLILVTIASIIIPGYITYVNDLDPTLLAFAPEIQDLSTNFYFTTAYIKTHMRASSYFLGLLLGYAVHKIQVNGTKIPNPTIWFGWILAAAFSISSLFSVVLFLDTSYTHDTLQSALYAPLHRVAWALSVGWVILVCVTDNAAVINKFLSWKFFVPLSRLTYCAYLVNGGILISHKGQMREAISWTVLELLFTLLGHLVTTLLTAFVLCICFESPIHGLEKIFLRKKDSSIKPNPPTTVLRVIEDNENT